MGLVGKLKSGLSSATKHLKKKHFKMTATELADNWGKLRDAGSVYFSLKKHAQPYEIDEVRRDGEGEWKKIEIWYYAEGEDEGVYEREKERLDPTFELWIHLSEAQYENLIEKHGDFLGRFEVK
ncbi:hypothetical protein [Thermococcus sp.]|uniref:hypothetical protein n=1 Tax=Thermococcus sp. TaxID=35749 RepID=UPI0026228D87|nr:hypothetical protein [Thermococcus sp.]